MASVRAARVEHSGESRFIERVLERSSRIMNALVEARLQEAIRRSAPFMNEDTLRAVLENQSRLKR